MSMPFYVSPEQVMADKAEFARKGIARGKSIVALEHQAGVMLMADGIELSRDRVDLVRIWC